MAEDAEEVDSGKSASVPTQAFGASRLGLGSEALPRRHFALEQTAECALQFGCNGTV